MNAVPDPSASRILLVDDVEALLAVTEQYLRRLGYSTLACRTAGGAWAAFQADPLSFRLVLTDITLPEMPGTELVLRMLDLNPRVAVLICSGYPFDPASLPARYQPQIGFLQKPFTPRMLAEAVERALAPDAGAPPR